MTIARYGHQFDSQQRPAIDGWRSYARRVATAIAVSGAVLAVSNGSARSEYRLQGGDVLEIRAASLPDFPQRATVGVDGELTFPYFGPARVAGLGVSDVRAKIKEILSRTPARRWTQNGRDELINIEPAEISVDIVTYVPIYVSGDVSKPGEYPFRPGMDVLQAVALAGGFDLMKFRSSNPFLEAADEKSEYDALMIELARLKTAMARIQAELDGKSQFRPPASATDVPSKLLAQFAQLEGDTMNASLDDFAKEQSSLRRQSELTDTQLAQLSNQRDVQKKSLADASLALSQARASAGRGYATVTRVEDEQRFYTQVSDRIFQSGAEYALAQRTNEELKLRADALVRKRRLALLKDAGDAQARIATVRTRVEAILEKLVYTGVVKSQLRGRGDEPDIEVVRKAGDDRTSFAANENTELQPGDVVLISLKLAVPPLAPSSTVGSASKGP